MIDWQVDSGGATDALKQVHTVLAAAGASGDDEAVAAADAAADGAEALAAAQTPAMRKHWQQHRHWRCGSIGWRMQDGTENYLFAQVEANAARDAAVAMSVGEGPQVV